MERERSAMFLGLGLLAAGVVVLVFVLMSALSLAANPGPFFDQQVGAPGPSPPQAAFAWASNDLNVTFTDLSTTSGGGSIVSRDWDLGDGASSTQESLTHAYASDGNYQVTLRVRDDNDQESVAISNVNVMTGGGDGGSSQSAPNFDIGLGLLPKALFVAVLTFGMHVVAFLVGASLVKAGWNLIRPRPETIRVKIRPSQFEQGATAEVVQPPMQPPTSPPPPPMPAPPPPE